MTCGILVSAGIPPEEPNDDQRQADVDHESRALFKALLALNQPISQTCHGLEEVAKQYGKQKERI